MTSLTMEDAEAILHDVSLIKTFPEMWTALCLLLAGTATGRRTTVVSPRNFDIRSWELAEGVPLQLEM